MDSLKNFDNDLLKELECPICMEYMKPPILMCENGHSICNSCRLKLSQCPSCRKAFTKVRNLALESLTTMAVTPPEEKVPSTPSYKCPFAKISHEDCTWSGRLKNMKKHIRTFHNSQSECHVSDGYFNVVLTGVSSTRHYRKAQLIHQEVFYVFWELRDEKFYCAVLNIADEANASNFKYRFSLTSKDGVKKISMIFKTRSVLEDVDKILKPGECVLLHYETVAEFLDPNKVLSCDFEISPVGAPSLETFTSQNESRSSNATDSCKNTEAWINKAGKSEFVGANDSDYSRGRGRFPGRHARGRGGRGRRGLSDMHHSGPLGLFSEGAGNLSKGKKLGWSLSDLRDESHYEQDEPSSPITKKSVGTKGKSGVKGTDMRSQIDSMSNNELRELIMKTLEEKFASMSSSSGQEEYSEARGPSPPRQRSNSRGKTFSSIHSLPKEDIIKIINKSFNDPAEQKSLPDSNKTSSSSQKTNPKVPQPEQPSSGKQYFTGKTSIPELNQAHPAQEKKSPDKSTSKEASGSSAASTKSNIYPTNLLELSEKSLYEGNNLQSVPVKSKIPSSPNQKSGMSNLPFANFQPSNVPKVTDTKFTAPKFDANDIWICALCNQPASKKYSTTSLNKSFKPEGTTWFCKLCEYWR